MCQVVRNAACQKVTCDPVSSSYRDALVTVVDVDAVLSPRDGRLRVPAGRLALQHSRLAHCHHDVHWVLPEVIAQDWSTEKCRETKTFKYILMR